VQVLFGGSFDPIHQGHLDLASRVCDRYHPKKLFLIPNRKNPLKDFDPGADAVDRLQMTLLGVGTLNRPEIQVVDWELQRPGPSYTWDTVQIAKSAHPDPATALVIGDEVFHAFAQWHRAAELLATVDLIVCSRERPVAKLDIERVVMRCGVSQGVWKPATEGREQRFSHSHGRRWIETLTFDALPISASEIREVLSTYHGKVRPPGLPAPVWEYIKKRKLYSVK